MSALAFVPGFGRTATGFPIIGTRWRKRTDSKCETRTVTGHTVGGSVVYVHGLKPKPGEDIAHREKRVTLGAWNEWARLAKRLAE